MEGCDSGTWLQTQIVCELYRMQSKLSDQDVIYGYVSSSANDSELPDNVLRPTISSFPNKLYMYNFILSD
jgi:hypothetical protein